jgi:hypothetical protein
MTFDYEAYVADFLTGDDDGLIERWFAPIARWRAAAAPSRATTACAAFSPGRTTGVRECPRIVSHVQQGRDLFAEIDMDFHATKERADFPFQHLFPGDSITVKFLAHYVLNEQGKVWRLKTMVWPPEKGVSKLPPLGPHPSQLAAYSAYTAAFSNGDPERYTRFYTDDVELLLGSVPPMRGPAGDRRFLHRDVQAGAREPDGALDHRERHRDRQRHHQPLHRHRRCTGLRGRSAEQGRLHRGAGARDLQLAGGTDRADRRSSARASR